MIRPYVEAGYDVIPFDLKKRVGRRKESTTGRK